MRKRILTGLAAVAVLALGGAGLAAASGGFGSRLDDGANLQSQAKITEAQAIRAAQSAATGSLNEVDLEDYQGTLVYNVDVGASDVKVDASTGDVLATTSDD